MKETRPEDARGRGLSLEKAAEMLGVDAERVKLLAAQGRLKTADAGEEPRYDLDSVLSMQAENLIREMLEEAGDKHPELRVKIDTLAALQYQRGREGAQRAEHWEIVERIEKTSAGYSADVERQLAAFQKINEDANKRNEEARRRHEEMRAMNEDTEQLLEETRALAEGRLRPLPRDQEARKSS